jgi:hypothetical protein
MCMCLTPNYQQLNERQIPYNYEIYKQSAGQGPNLYIFVSKSGGWEL